MALFTSAILKNYFSSYRGLSNYCWQGIFLNFLEAILSGVGYFLSVYFVNVLHINIAIASVIISFYGLGTILGGYLGGEIIR